MGRPVRTFVDAFVRNESGATAMEYGLIVALIAAALVTALTAVGVNIGGTFNTISAAVKK